MSPQKRSKRKFGERKNPLLFYENNFKFFSFCYLKIIFRRRTETFIVIIIIIIITRVFSRLLPCLNKKKKTLWRCCVPSFLKKYFNSLSPIVSFLFLFFLFLLSFLWMRFLLTYVQWLYLRANEWEKEKEKDVKIFFWPHKN